MTPLTPEMLEVVRELRGIVSLSARLRFCAELLTAESTTPLDTRITVVRCVLTLLALEVDAAQVRLARPRAHRVTDLLDEIRTIAKARIHVRKDRLAKVYHLAREAGRLMRSAS